jgi:hypothetical protein
MEMDELREFVLRRIKHAEKRVTLLKEREGEKPSENLTYWGGQSLGYWQGKLSAYETILDEIDGI